MKNATNQHNTKLEKYTNGFPKIWVEEAIDRKG
jgi:hypothetical protein